MKIPEVRLNPKRERSVQNLHPWIFSGALEREYKHIESGSIVRVLSAEGVFLGLGHFFDANIAVKLFSFKPEVIDYKFWRERIRLAVELRQSLGLFTSSKTNAFRLVNAEGDALPGLIVDLYNQTAVVQFQSEGMQKLQEDICLALREVLGDKLLSIFWKRVEDKQTNDFGTYLFGKKEPNIISEHGLKFEVDWEHGQKTGFFLDQRDNRELLRQLAHGREVLNCFCYSGAFSVYALKGGANFVTSVDASEAAGELCQRNIQHNFSADERAGYHRFIRADCFDFLRKLDKQYDLIVLDPPAFSKHRGARDGGAKGYDSINSMALKQIRPGGILFTFSCSQHMPREEFFDLVRRAARRTNRAVQVLKHLSAAPCHPLSISHPEGEYLKGLALVVR